MSKWLALAQKKIAAEKRVPIVPLVPIGRGSRAIGAIGAASEGSISDKYRDDAGAFGTNGTIGTVPQDELLERQAFAEIDGQVPPAFSLAFAAFQMDCPSGRTEGEWRTAIDDAGRFLDSHGQQAAALGWQASDLFGSGGLVWTLKEATVAALNSSRAVLSDGRKFQRQT